jgi:hypothetical protein
MKLSGSGKFIQLMWRNKVNGLKKNNLEHSIYIRNFKSDSLLNGCTDKIDGN